MYLLEWIVQWQRLSVDIAEWADAKIIQAKFPDFKPSGQGLYKEEDVTMEEIR